MSPLAFDKQGKPFAWHRRTRKLLVRMFRNPAARGTCCQVLDAEGNPLYIDAETEYSEFRKAVGNVPGLYRLDQSDEDGVEIDDAQPAYVSIDLTRNASLTGDGDADPLVIIEHMFAIHADVMKTMAMQQASIMAASAEILRAPFRPPTSVVARDPRDDDKDDKDNDDDDEEDELEPDPWASWRPMLEMVEPHLPKLGAFLLAQFVAFMKTATPPAATPSIPSPGPAPAPHSAATPIQSAEATGAAAGSSPASSPSAPSSTNTPTPFSSTAAAAPAGPPSARVDNAPTPADAETNAPSHPIAQSTPAATSVASTQTAAAIATVTPTSSSTSTPSSAGTALAIAPSAPTGSPRNAPPAPAPDQWEHLHEIRERLSPKERAIAENAIMRMDADLLTRYLADLSAQSVDDAVVTIRSMIAKLPATRGRERG